MLIFLHAHLMADFVFQTQKQIEAKQSNNIVGNLDHLLTLIIIYFAASMGLYFAANMVLSQVVLLVAFVLINAGVHLLVDLAKTTVIGRVRQPLVLLLIDQGLHIGVLILSYRWLLSDVVLSTELHRFFLNALFPLLATFVGSVFVRDILCIFHLGERNDQHHDVSSADGLDRQNSGRWIGIIERAILFLAFVLEAYALAAVVVAFKTLARYSEIKDDPEYYIIGNLLSLLVVLGMFALYALV